MPDDFETNMEVVAVSLNTEHTFSKYNLTKINLLEGFGVEGDAHMGKTVQHLYNKMVEPDCINLRQVHLIQCELFDELKEKGFHVKPGELGENITTKGVDLLNLPKGSRMKIGDDCIIEITGLRNPCPQIDSFKDGLMAKLMHKDEEGNIIRKAGVMAIVVKSGVVRPKDKIKLQYPDGEFIKLEVV